MVFLWIVMIWCFVFKICQDSNLQHKVLFAATKVNLLLILVPAESEILRQLQSYFLGLHLACFGKIIKLKRDALCYGLEICSKFFIKCCAFLVNSLLS
ncbi:hypothetical protein HQ37_00180 [Porphyromonas sp. COT-239 OH1446]|nr:hypothetical protein HQ37_00180 [Porphyromonas sp. COT-239 OH1446]